MMRILPANGRRNNSDNLDSKPTRQPKHPLRKKNNAHRPDIDNDLAERLTQKIRKNKIVSFDSRRDTPSHIPHNGNENKKKTPGIITQPRKIRTEQGNDPSKQITEYLLYAIENPLENDR